MINVQCPIDLNMMQLLGKEPIYERFHQTWPRVSYMRVPTPEEEFEYRDKTQRRQAAFDLECSTMPYIKRKVK